MNLQKELITYQSETDKRFKSKTQDYNKVEINSEVFRFQSCNMWRVIQDMAFGKERRQHIIKWCETQTPEMYWHIPYGFIVNSKTQSIINKDNDLKYLIKHGKLKQINIRRSSNTTYNCLVLSDKYNCTGQLIK